MSDKIDVSIIIVHTFEKDTLRQTLRSIRRNAPVLQYEVIVVDNNPAFGFSEVLEDFPDIRYFPLEANIGFGAAMNVGIRAARGEYVLIFNPDILISPGSLDALKAYMDAHPDVGVCGPQLHNPDGGPQFSCHRIPPRLWPLYSRTPIGKFSFGKHIVDHHLMKHEDYHETKPVHAMIGAALFTRGKALNDVGLFDERFFMYYEDDDLCRRFWEKGYKVMYYPEAKMMHYHRRASADGGLFSQIFNRFTWIQLKSFWHYQRKYWRKPDPIITTHGGESTTISD